MACLTCFKLNEDCTCTNDNLEYGILERKCKELEQQLTEEKEANRLYEVTLEQSRRECERAEKSLAEVQTELGDTKRLLVVAEDRSGRNLIRAEKAEGMFEISERQNKQLEQENKRLLTLLKVATCPACDGSGAIGRYTGGQTGCPSDYEWEQCQWCYEREQALKEVVK